ncbi:MAG: type IV pilin protein [Candidatus Hydrothermia bacterium]
MDLVTLKGAPYKRGASNFDRHNRNSRGFTLIELLIVLSIFSILITVAIAFFKHSRISAFNATAEYDLTNVRTFLEAIYAEYKTYPEVLRNPETGRVLLEVRIGDETDTVTFLTSRSVFIQVKEDPLRSSYTAIAKHKSGDTYFGIDSDSPHMYFKQNNSYVGGVEDVFLPDPTLGQVDFDDTWSIK